MTAATISATSPAASRSAPATLTTGDRLLTVQQQRFFDVFGYIALPGLLADCIGEIQDAFEGVWSTAGGGHNGKPHDGSARSCIVPFVDQSERLSALIDDPRVHGAAVSLLGDDFNYMGSDGNYYVGDTAWHRDGGHRGVRFIKMAFYLDPLTASSGCLRVVPGSHRIDDTYGMQVGECAGDHHGQINTAGHDFPAMALETTPGDLLIFNHNTLHSSWKGGTRRRMFTMNLCTRYPEERLPELREYIASHDRFQIDRNVGPMMLKHASPGRMRHLEQVMANDFLLTERSRALRAKGVEPSRG